MLKPSSPSSHQIHHNPTIKIWAIKIEGVRYQSLFSVQMNLVNAVLVKRSRKKAGSVLMPEGNRPGVKKQQNQSCFEGAEGGEGAGEQPLWIFRTFLFLLGEAAVSPRRPAHTAISRISKSWKPCRFKTPPVVAGLKTAQYSFFYLPLWSWRVISGII